MEQGEETLTRFRKYFPACKNDALCYDITYKMEANIYPTNYN